MIKSIDKYFDELENKKEIIKLEKDIQVKSGEVVELKNKLTVLNGMLNDVSEDYENAKIKSDLFEADTKLQKEAQNLDKDVKKIEDKQTSIKTQILKKEEGLKKIQDSLKEEYKKGLKNILETKLEEQEEFNRKRFEYSRKAREYGDKFLNLEKQTSELRIQVHQVFGSI